MNKLSSIEYFFNEVIGCEVLSSKVKAAAAYMLSYADCRLKYVYPPYSVYSANDYVRLYLVDKDKNYYIFKISDEELVMNVNYKEKPLAVFSLNKIHHDNIDPSLLKMMEMVCKNFYPEW